jgi:hypothetical protein
VQIVPQQRCARSKRTASGIAAGGRAVLWFLLLTERQRFRQLLSLITIPLVPATRTDPIVWLQLRVIDLVIVRAPKPPGSRQSISPAGAVLEIAPAKVLQGAVRLHGLASSPALETQVRVACAWAGVAAKSDQKSDD